MTEIRHTIGDEVYSLDMLDGSYRTVAYPVVKRTEKYLYVAQIHGHMVRFRVADLERTGRGWSHRWCISVHTNPLPHWPPMAAGVRTESRNAAVQPTAAGLADRPIERTV